MAVARLADAVAGDRGIDPWMGGIGGDGGLPVVRRGRLEGLFADPAGGRCVAARALLANGASALDEPLEGLPLAADRLGLLLGLLVLGSSAPSLAAPAASASTSASASVGALASASASCAGGAATSRTAAGAQAITSMATDTKPTTVDQRARRRPIERPSLSDRRAAPVRCGTSWHARAGGSRRQSGHRSSARPPVPRRTTVWRSRHSIDACSSHRSAGMKTARGGPLDRSGTPPMPLARHRSSS